MRQYKAHSRPNGSVAMNEKELLIYDLAHDMFEYQGGDLIRRKDSASNFAGKKGEIAGSKRKDGYRKVIINKHAYLSHRIIWLMFHGEFPRHQIDHINGIRDDNRIENLRDVNSSENNKNKAMDSRNSTGVAGVYWFKRDNRWMARIQSDGKDDFLGYFDIFEDAVKARKEAELEYDFHENHGRKL